MFDRIYAFSHNSENKSASPHLPSLLLFVILEGNLRYQLRCETKQLFYLVEFANSNRMNRMDTWQAIGTIAIVILCIRIYSSITVSPCLSMLILASASYLWVCFYFPHFMSYLNKFRLSCEIYLMSLLLLS